jgi:GMP synthase (glutamine-hydrolysing)
MKSAVIVRHVAFEDLGTFEPVLASLAYRIVWHEAGRANLPADLAMQADLLVVLGGPIGVYDTDDYPFMTQEIDVVRRRLAVDAPTLGICLGSQIMAAAMGAKVYPGSNGKEIGWSTLELTPDGAQGPLAEIGPDRTGVLHWHGDTFDLPAGACLLASTGQYRHQAFSIGRRGLALQFHPEVSATGLESWFIGHALEIASTPGLSVRQLRAETARHAPTLAQCGPAMLKRWLADIAMP